MQTPSQPCLLSIGSFSSYCIPSSQSNFRNVVAVLAVNVEAADNGVDAGAVARFHKLREEEIGAGPAVDVRVATRPQNDNPDVVLVDIVIWQTAMSCFYSCLPVLLCRVMVYKLPCQFLLSRHFLSSLWSYMFNRHVCPQQWPSYSYTLDS